LLSQRSQRKATKDACSSCSPAGDDLNNHDMVAVHIAGQSARARQSVCSSCSRITIQSTCLFCLDLQVKAQGQEGSCARCIRLQCAGPSAAGTSSMGAAAADAHAGNRVPISAACEQVRCGSDCLGTRSTLWLWVCSSCHCCSSTGRSCCFG
jgi:hypothetical protein